MRVSRKPSIERTLQAMTRKRIAVPAAPIASGSMDWGKVIALPASPNPGDTCRFVVDEANGIIWDLVYVWEGLYPWAKIGGPPLRHAPVVSKTTASTAYQSTDSPSLTAPLAMEARVEFGAALMASQVAELNEMRIAAHKTATEIDWCAVVVGTQFAGSPGSRRPRTTLTKGQVVTTRYRSVNGKSSTFHNMYIELDPIRVG